MLKKEIFEYRFSNLLLALGIVACTAISIVSSLLMGNFIDFLSVKNEFDKEILIYLCLILVISVLSMGSNVYLAQFLPLKLQLNKSIEYSRDVMDGVLKVSQKNYLKREKGYYINLVTSSAFTCGDIYGQINVELVGNACCVLLLIIIAAYINLYFALIYLMYIPLFAVVVKTPSLKIANLQKVGLPTQDAFLSGTKKIVEDKRAINIARAGEYYSKLYKNRSEKYLKFITKFKWYTILSTNIPKIMSGILIVIIMGITAKLYFKQEVTLGTFFVIFQLSQLLQEPLNRCFEIIIYRSINEAHIERVREFKEEQKQSDGFRVKYQKMKNLALLNDGKIYSSPEKEKMLFSIAKMVFPKKKLILLKGGNGTGKSTLLNLLTGFSDIEVYEGELKLENSLSKASYLSYPILFAEGDLKENMFGTGIDSEVFEMLGITFGNKKINEAGVNLSYGEQQKLGLLRVLSQESDVIVLDEPFSNLDKETVQHLTSYLVQLKEKKSVIAVMHSNELDEFADVIFEIRDKKCRLNLLDC